MANIKELKIVEICSDIEAGFFWIMFVDELYLQCCVSKENGFDKNDMGEDWGICGDVNAKAFEKYGQEQCVDLLIEYAEKHFSS